MSFDEWQLQFERTRIKEFASRYVYGDDSGAMQAGERIAGGDCGRANLETIFNWKTAAGESRGCAVRLTWKSGMHCD